MTRGTQLGELELFVLAAVERLGPDAYSVSIQEEIERRARRPTSVGAVFITLNRLEDKGLLRCALSEPLPVRGGRARKCATLTAPGRRALLRSGRALGRMLQGLIPEFGALGE